MRFAKILLLLPLVCIFSFLGCANAQQGYVSISHKEAKQLMDTEKDYVILDVREEEEFKAGHIPNAMLLPLGMVEKEAEKLLPNKQQLLLVHCRSGRRSKMAAKILVGLGYTNIKEFGGIIDWPYEVVK